MTPDQELQKIKTENFAGGTYYGRTPGGIVDLRTNQIVPGTATNTSPVATSPVRRFTSNAAGTYEGEREKIIGSLDITPPDETEKQRIRDEQLKAVQSQLDAIDSATSVMLADEATRATERTGRGRAINARSGVLGSDMGERRAGDIEAVNKQGREAILAAQEAKKVAVLDKAATRAAELAENAKNEALKNADTYLNFLATKQTEARTDVKAMASAGVTLDQLSNDEYQTLLDQSGYGSQFLFDAVYNSQLPANAKKEYEYVNLGSGKVVRFNKAGGAPEYFDYSVPEGFQFKMAGDIPVFVNEKTQEVKVAAPGGDMANAAQYAKETELDTYTDASGNRVSVMYNPVSKATRKIVLGKAGSADGTGGFPSGFKPQAFEVSAVSQFITNEGRTQNQSQADIDAAIKRAQSDPGFFYSTLGVILGDEKYSNKYYKPTTLGIPTSIVVGQ